MVIVVCLESLGGSAMLMYKSIGLVYSFLEGNQTAFIPECSSAGVERQRNNSP